MRINLSSEDIKAPERYQRNISDGRSYVKVTCILMLSKGLLPKDVSDFLGIDDSTVYRYANSYLQDDLDTFLFVYNILSGQIIQLREMVSAI